MINNMINKNHPHSMQAFDSSLPSSPVSYTTWTYRAGESRATVKVHSMDTTGVPSTARWLLLTLSLLVSAMTAGSG